MPKLRPPAGYAPYRGAEPSFQPAADKTHWFAQYCNGPRGWGMYVFQQSAAGSEPAHEVPYAAPLMANRGHFELGGDGVLYVTGGTGDNDPAGRAEVVFGFIPFVAGSTPIVLPPTTATVDQVARNFAQQAQNAAVAAQSSASKAQKTADDAINRVNAGLKRIQDTVKFIQDSMWQKGLDAAYFVLKQRGLIKDE